MIYIKREKVTLRCFDNFYLNVYIYGDYTKPNKGIIQMVHGIAEYSNLYEEIIDHLVKNFYIVVIHDHRGHGIYNESKEYFHSYTNDNSFGVMVKDLKVINSFIRWKFKGKKVYLIGHSMGGYLSLKYSEVYGNSIDGLVLSGIGKGDIHDRLIPEAIIKSMCGFLDASKPNKFISKTFYEILNMRFKDKTYDDNFSFATSDKEVILRYINDDLRVRDYTLKFYHDLFNGINNTVNNRSLKKIPKDLKILLITGSLDPVCYFTKGAKKLSRSISKNDVSVEHIIYDGMRHELFVEDMKHEVFDDIVKFLSKF